jgi:hypothetical protein
MGTEEVLFVGPIDPATFQLKKFVKKKRTKEM